MTNFLDFKFNKQILSAIEDLGYQTPTEIQQKAIPLAMAGHDLFGIAQTGTGKTAAYMLPILMKTKFAQGVNPRALILAPTRELAIQIGEAIRELTKYTDLRHTVIYGGSAIKFQIEDVRKGIASKETKWFSWADSINAPAPGKADTYFLSGSKWIYSPVAKKYYWCRWDGTDKNDQICFLPPIQLVS